MINSYVIVYKVLLQYIPAVQYKSLQITVQTYHIIQEKNFLRVYISCVMISV